MAKQYGGEGKTAYKGTKTDASFKQLGGEGKNLSKGGSAKLNSGMSGTEYCGPGRYLGSVK